MTESRICVKNIGKSTKEDTLRNHFSKCGEITDLKILRRPDGTSRNFAFIGFRTPQQAQEAKKYFDNTFMGLSRLSVSFARKLGEVDQAEKQRREKMENRAKLAAAKAAPTKEAVAAPARPLSKKEEATSKKKEKFLELKLHRKGTALPETTAVEEPQDEESEPEEAVNDNETSDDDQGVSEEEESVEESAEEDVGDEDDDFVDLEKLKPLSDLDYLRSKIVKNHDQPSGTEPKATKKADDDEDVFSSDEEQDEEEEMSEDEGDVDAPASKPTARHPMDADIDSEDEDALDLDDLLQGKTKKDAKAKSKDAKKDKKDKKDKSRTKPDPEETVASAETMDISEEPAEDSMQQQQQQQEERVISKTRLYVTNLPYSAGEDEVRQLFIETLGNDASAIVEVHLPLNKIDKKTKGFGFVRLSSVEAAEMALSALHGASFQGRVLHLTFATEAPIAGGQSDVMGSGHGAGMMMSSFQKQREEERRKALVAAGLNPNAAGSSQQQHALHVRSEAVVSAMASRYQMSADNLLDVGGTSGGDVAVRVALAETQILQDNASFLTSFGISPDATMTTSSSSSGNNHQRSDRVLLVKNLPVSCVASELEAQLGRHGALHAFALAPSKTLAVAVFLEPSEARNAYKQLAYRRYQGAPLYLEFAPMDPSLKNTNTNTSKAATASATAAATTTTTPSTKTSTTTGSSSATTSTVFIKNLHFHTDETALQTHLTQALRLPAPRSVVIQRKAKTPNSTTNNTQWLSQGYGFVEFASPEIAQRAVSLLRGSVLDAHALDAQLSSSTASSSHLAQQKSASAQLILHSHQEKDEDHPETANHAAVKGGGTKLLVRNVAFQATKAELRALFGAHGAVQSVRLPQSMSHNKASASQRNHRGFAFVDFATKQEAANAKAALQHAHFYGRHLVVEFEENEGSSSGGGLLSGAQGSGSGVGELLVEDEGLRQGRKRAQLDAKHLEAQERKAGVQAKRSRLAASAKDISNGGSGEGGGGEESEAVQQKKMRALL